MGLEPTTYWLQVSCTTNRAHSAFDCVADRRSRTLCFWLMRPTCKPFHSSAMYYNFRKHFKLIVTNHHSYKKTCWKFPCIVCNIAHLVTPMGIEPTYLTELPWKGSDSTKSSSGLWKTLQRSARAWVLCSLQIIIRILALESIVFDSY